VHYLVQTEQINFYSQLFEVSLYNSKISYVLVSINA